MDHWTPTQVSLGLSGTESVPGLELRISGVLSSDQATLDAKDVCTSAIAVINSFTAALKLILLPGDDVRKVGLCFEHSLTLFQAVEAGLGFSHEHANSILNFEADLQGVSGAPLQEFQLEEFQSLESLGRRTI